MGKPESSVRQAETGTASAHVAWERRYERIDRWIPYALLLLSTVVALANGDLTDQDQIWLIGLLVLTVAWVGLMHTRVAVEVRSRPSHALVYTAGLLTCAALLLWLDPAFFIFAITGFLHAAHLRPRWMVFVGVGATSLLILARTWEGFPHLSLAEFGGFVVLFGLQTVLIGYGVIGGERLAELAEQRRRTVAQLESTLAENEGLHTQLLAQAHEAGIQDERRRMAREIHDTVAQGLAGIVTQLEAADQRAGDIEAVRHHLDAAAALARESLAEARRSVQALGPGALERGRLAGALETVTQDWTHHTGITVGLQVDGVPPTLPTDVEVALLRVGQEALANVAKHAGAQAAELSLVGDGSRVTLQVRDDGCGFDPAVASGTGFGLQTMHERVAEVGGMLTVDTAPGAGTKLVAAVPLNDKGRD